MNLQRARAPRPAGSRSLGQVPAAYRSPTGNWVGMALRVSSLVYDPARVPRSQLPASILDLAQAAVEGEGRDRSDGLRLPADRRRRDRDARAKAAAAAWLAGLKRNAGIYQDEEAVVAAVNRGDVAAA